MTLDSISSHHLDKAITFKYVAIASFVVAAVALAILFPPAAGLVLTGLALKATVVSLSLVVILALSMGAYTTFKAISLLSEPISLKEQKDAIEVLKQEHIREKASILRRFQSTKEEAESEISKYEKEIEILSKKLAELESSIKKKSEDLQKNSTDLEAKSKDKETLESDIIKLKAELETATAQTLKLGVELNKKGIWTPEYHQAMLKQGIMQDIQVKDDPNGQRSLFIFYRKSNTPGFGTESTRHLVQKSRELNLEGRLHNSASYSSHVFHLYMGMLPVNTQIPRIEVEYGISGKEAIKKYPLLKEKFLDIIANNDSFSETEQYYIQDLKRIVKDKHFLSALSPIDDNDLFWPKTSDDLEEKLKSYSTETVSDITYNFIPKLLGALKASKNKKKPDTMSLGSFSMILSDAGRVRWFDAIDRGVAFTPFKRFEHLVQFMTSKQKEDFEAYFRSLS
jgi:hypothetical protein